MILIKDIWKSFDQKEVLRGLSLQVPAGETLVIMGRSGCGKSLLLKMIAGLLCPERGEIFYNGQGLNNLNRKDMNRIRNKIGFLFQSAALFDFMTVSENVGFMLSQHTKMSRLEIERIVTEKLSLVDLSGTELLKPAELSGGMRKRVGLARAIVSDPDLILYDEPTTGLDPITCVEINNLINNLHETLEATSVVVTHDIDSAFSVATRIAMIHQGRTIIDGTPDEIMNSTDPHVQEFVSQEFRNQSI